VLNLVKISPKVGKVRKSGRKMMNMLQQLSGFIPLLHEAINNLAFSSGLSGLSDFSDLNPIFAPQS